MEFGIMNDICKACYSNSELGATARNLNIEDIEAVLNISAWNPRSYAENGYHTYTDSRQETTYKNYPYIWQFEEYANIGGVSSTDSRTINIEEGEGISRSTQPRNPDDPNGYWTETYNTAQISITPTQTGWSKNIDEIGFFDTGLASILNYSQSTNNRFPKFFLSTRYVNAYTLVSTHDNRGVTWEPCPSLTSKSFGLAVVDGGKIDSSDGKISKSHSFVEPCLVTLNSGARLNNIQTCYFHSGIFSQGDGWDRDAALRPVVCLDLRQCMLRVSSAGTSGNPYTVIAK